jgi:hypothetical protein
MHLSKCQLVKEPQWMLAHLQDLQAIMGWIIMCAGNLPIKFESSNIQLSGGWKFSEGIISRSSAQDHQSHASGTQLS